MIAAVATGTAMTMPIPKASTPASTISVATSVSANVVHHCW